MLAIEGKTLRLAGQVKVGEKRLSGISFTSDGKAAIVALRDENGASVLSVDGTNVALTKERISTGVNPYAIDISSDGRWAVIGNTGTSRTVDDADVVTLVDVGKRPFRAVQQISVSATPEGVAISPDGRWIAVSSMAGSNLLATDPGRHKLGRVSLFEIRNGAATRVSEIPGGEAAQGVVFTQDSKTVIVQFDVERALAVYAIRDGKLVDTGERIRLAAGPASIRSMPRFERREHRLPRAGLDEALATIVAHTGGRDTGHRIEHRFAERLRVGKPELALDRVVDVRGDAAAREDELVEVLRLGHQHDLLRGEITDAAHRP